MLERLYNILINPNVCFLIIAFKIVYTISCMYTTGTSMPLKVKISPICIIEATRNLSNVDFLYHYIYIIVLFLNQVMFLGFGLLMVYP